MALPLSITLSVTGEASAKEYRYSPDMSIFGSNSQSTSQENEQGKDDAKAKEPRQLFVPYAVRITRADILKAGEFVDPKKVTSKDLLRALGSESSAVRALDYAEARSGDKGVELDESSKSGLLQENINTVLQLAFKDDSKIQLQSEVYTIYSNKLVSWKLNPKTPYGSASISAVVNISLVRGTQIGTLKKQRLKCPGRREALRESVKEVFKKDFLGAPSNKPSKVVSRRLIQPRSSSSSSSGGSRYLSNEDRRRLSMLYPYDPRYAPSYSRNGRSRTRSQSLSPSSTRGGMRKKRNRTRKNKNRKRKTRRNYVFKTWVI
jgi:hypothetical protein